jgi:aspartate carbamoyltransferase catalytic subunit
LEPEVADGPGSVILDQVFNGILVRMSVLAHICNPSALFQWLESGGHRV